MKFIYFNILLFALPLNILAHNHRNHYITTHTQTNRSLCECELYAPANYDNDPQMKEVMQQFEDRASQRLHEYDERMKSTRQKCKDQCDKEIQKIILKDKLEKELTEKFSTLQTDIQNNAIPTCICGKSMADKVEKGCLRCGYGLGTAAPTVGLIGSVAIGAWKEVATASAIDFATEAGIKAGIKVAIAQIKDTLSFRKLSFIKWQKYINGTNYNSTPGLVEAANAALNSIEKPSKSLTITINMARDGISHNSEGWFGTAVKDGIEATASTTENVKNAALGTIESTTTTSTTAIIAAVVAIVVIVLILVIIYKILRYRRKKKMKKKLQYIKLLQE
ncbi:rifin [Plasmodium reichenowi]|uniref:Rifin n=1 Tax=Plasmodium reichenowi TaxID=5854 RepID=A0A060RQ90_PLARE|nr:rifin [Plasmodium reichenowi]